MARVLVRLKLTLLRAGLRTSGVRGVLGAVLALVTAVVAGLVGAGAFFATRFLDGRAATDATAGGMAVVLVIWVLGPIVAAGAEGALDPGRLALFPLTTRQLMPGLLLGALVGFGGLATVLALGGAIAGMAPWSPLLVVTAAAAALHLLLCAGASRLVSTAISSAVRTRRWRDVALFAGPLIAVVINVGLQVVTRSVAPGDSDVPADSPALRSARVLVRYLPSGPAALAMGYAREGRIVPALAALALAAGLVMAVVTFWGRVLQRLLTTSSGGGGSVRPGRPPRPLLPRWAPFLPHDRVGAVAAKELRLSWRDPRQRAALLGMVFAAAVPALSLRVLSSSDPRAVLAAALPAYILAAAASNQYGFDGQAHWANVSAGDDPRSDLLGKNIARAVTVLPLVVVVLVVLGVRAPDLRSLLPALGLATAAFGVNLGLGNVTSVVVPLPLPDNPANVFSAGNSGRGLSAAAPSMAVLFGGMALLAPLLLAALLLEGPVAGTLVGLAGVVYGTAGWALGLRIAVRRSAPRQAELLEALSNRHAG